MFRFRRILSFIKLNNIIKRDYAVIFKVQKIEKFAVTINPNKDNILLTFGAANAIYYNKQIVKQIDVPSFSGEFGILARHVPTLAILRPGVVTVFETDGKISRIFVSSGSITVNDDSTVIILAEEAHPVERFDATACKKLLEEAQNLLFTAKNPKEKATAEISLEVAQKLVRCVS